MVFQWMYYKMEALETIFFTSFFSQELIFITYKNVWFRWYYKWKQQKYNSKWPYFPDHPYRMLIIGGSGSGKTNALLDLIIEQDDSDNFYLYAKDLS